MQETYTATVWGPPGPEAPPARSWPRWAWGLAMAAVVVPFSAGLMMLLIALLVKPRLLPVGGGLVLAVGFGWLGVRLFDQLAGGSDD